MRLSGKAAIITGSARGIGRAIAEAYAKDGAELLLVDSLSAVEQTAREIGKDQDRLRVLAYQLDLRKTEMFEELAQYAFDTFGKVDILVNNAGVCKRNYLADLEEEEWDWHFDINVKAMFFLTKSVVRRMIAQGVKGRIINTASIMAKIGEAGFAAYTASKHAILGFGRCLAFEMAPAWHPGERLLPGDRGYRHGTPDRWGDRARRRAGRRRKSRSGMNPSSPWAVTPSRRISPKQRYSWPPRSPTT